jgi:3-oxoacyl-[acyl-carrier protein] reductase
LTEEEAPVSTQLPQRFTGKSVVVTGAGSGIGRAIAEAFAAEGASVVISDINEAAGKEVARQIQETGGAGIAVRADVSDAASVREMFEEASRFGDGLDILVNNAGIPMRSTRLLDLPDAEWQRQLDVNLSGTYYGCKYGAPLVRERQGVIVNIASLAAIKVRPGFAAYAAAKAGVVLLTRALAQELAPEVRVNSVSPVSTDTAMLPELAPLGQSVEEFKVAVAAGIPLGRLNRPADVAAGVLFLCSTDAAMITGHNLVIDGGAS